MNKVPNLDKLGKFSGKEVYEIADYIDKMANPIPIMWSIKGSRIDGVWTSPSQKIILERLIKDMEVLVNQAEKENDHLSLALEMLKEEIFQIFSYNIDEVQFYSKDILMKIGHLITTILLGHMGSKLGKNRYSLLSKLYYIRFIEGKQYPREVIKVASKIFEIEKETELNLKIEV